jgi:hypothetical protein
MRRSSAQAAPAGCTNMGERYAIPRTGRPTADLHTPRQTVLISEETGQINWPSEKGLYFFDTRVVSSWTIYANDEPWELLYVDPSLPTWLPNRAQPPRG